MITYDKYYQTPRIWLIGYDEVHHTLTRRLGRGRWLTFYGIVESHPSYAVPDLPGRLS